VNWSKKFPIKEFRKLDLLPELRGLSNDIELLLAFFGVSSPDGWIEVWKTSRVAFRQTREMKTSIERVSAWVRVLFRTNQGVGFRHCKASKFNQPATRMHDLKSGPRY